MIKTNQTILETESKATNLVCPLNLVSRSLFIEGGEMLLREWICEGYADTTHEWVKLYTSPNANKKVAAKKLVAKLGETNKSFLPFIRLVKGEIVNH